MVSKKLEVISNLFTFAISLQYIAGNNKYTLIDSSVEL